MFQAVYGCSRPWKPDASESESVPRSTRETQACPQRATFCWVPLAPARCLGLTARFGKSIASCSRSQAASPSPKEREAAKYIPLHYLFVIPIPFVPLPPGSVAAFPFRVSVPSALTVKRVTVLVV
jgi:hypothetical protein